MIQSFEVYKLYLALQRHFTSKSYNFNKYNGQVRANHDSFLRRRDRGLFNKIRYKYTDGEEIKSFFIANLVYKDDFSIYNITSNKPYQVYEDWKKRNNSIADYYYKDLRLLSQKPIKGQLISNSGELPLVIQYYIQDKVGIESLVLLDTYFKFLDRNEILHDDDQFNDIALIINKYKTFLALDFNRLKKITIETIIK